MALTEFPWPYTNNDKHKILIDNHYNNIISKFEWVLCDLHGAYINLPIDNYIYNALKNIHDVKFEFIASGASPDSPIMAEDSSTINMNTGNFVGIDAFINYNIYNLINNLPQSESMLEIMPYIQTVIINGAPSNLFSELNDYINNYFDGINMIYVYKNGKYKLSTDITYIKNKSITNRFVRLNPHTPLFYHLRKHANIYGKLDRIDYTVSWYRKIQGMSINDIIKSQDSIADDYIYSYNTLSNIISSSIVWKYILVNYCTMNSNLFQNSFIICTTNIYLRVNDELRAFQFINTNERSYHQTIDHMLVACKRAIHDKVYI